MKNNIVIVIICIFLLGIIKPELMHAQQNNSIDSIGKRDTILVWTNKTPFTEEKHYVIDGSREMRISIYGEKKDTTILANICDYTMDKYKEELAKIKIRKLPIEKIDADLVYTYFTIGESIEEVTQRLGKKKVHVTDRGYHVAFYNKYTQQNEIFELCFIDGRLSSISRPSTNSLPTNNVWMAFQLLELKDVIDNLKKIH